MILVLHHSFIVSQPDLSDNTWVKIEVSHAPYNRWFNEYLCKSVRCVIKYFITRNKDKGYNKYVLTGKRAAAFSICMASHHETLFLKDIFHVFFCMKQEDILDCDTLFLRHRYDSAQHMSLFRNGFWVWRTTLTLGSVSYQRWSRFIYVQLFAHKLPP